MAGKSLYRNIAKGMELKEIDFSAWGGIDGFLLSTSTGGGNTAKPSLLRRVVPWIAKACDMTATRVATLPFDILDESDNVYDSSSTWKNKIGGIPSPTHIIALIAESLCMGKAYVIPSIVGNNLLNLQYCAPHTVVPLITTQGLSFFPRTSDWGASGIYAPAGIGSQTGDAYDTTNAIPIDSNENYTANGAPIKVTGGVFKGEMMYFWLPDSDVEIGPAKNYPMATALMATGILSKANLSIDLLADHGFIPPTLLAVSGTTDKVEKERAEGIWNDFIRGFSRLRAKIINTEKMDIKQVGAGMAELGSGAYKDISNEQKETIGAAFGIPAAIFMSDMAFASEVNPLVRQWLENGMFVKICNTIESTFNSQLFARFGLRLKFKPETLKAFQEDEVKRAAAFRSYVSAGAPPSIVGEMLGLDLPEGKKYTDLDEMYKKELENKDKPVAPMNNAIQPPQDRPEQGKGSAAAQPDKTPMNADMAKDLSLWKDISLRNFRKGKGRAVDFECKALPESIACHIREKLAMAQTELDIVKAFDLDQTAPMVKSEAAMVLEGIRLEIAERKALMAQKVK